SLRLVVEVLRQDVVHQPDAGEPDVPVVVERPAERERRVPDRGMLGAVLVWVSVLDPVVTSHINSSLRNPLCYGCQFLTVRNLGVSDVLRQVHLLVLPTPRARPVPDTAADLHRLHPGEATVRLLLGQVRQRLGQAAAAVEDIVGDHLLDLPERDELVGTVALHLDLRLRVARDLRLVPGDAGWVVAAHGTVTWTTWVSATLIGSPVARAVSSLHGCNTTLSPSRSTETTLQTKSDTSPLALSGSGSYWTSTTQSSNSSSAITFRAGPRIHHGASPSYVRPNGFITPAPLSGAA